MPGNLLIVRKNGRGVKTYGIKHNNIYIMKSTFLCIVTLISCNKYVLGDIEFYSDQNQGAITLAQLRNYLEYQQRKLLYQEKASSLLPLIRGNFPSAPWSNFPDSPNFNNDGQDNSDFVFAIPERNTPHAEHNNKHKMLYNTEGQYQFEFNQPILDDVRQYPNEQDSDFIFNDDNEDLKSLDGDGVENEQGIKPEPLERNDNVENARRQELFENVKTVSDPTDFAYAPPDPRFYKDTPNHESVATLPQNDEVLNNENQDQDVILVRHRNDENYSNLQDMLTNNFHDDTVEVVAVQPHQDDNTTGVYIIAVVAGISAAATVGLIAFGIGWYNLQKHVKSASDVEYPAYGITGPNKDTSPSGDRRLAQSAQMYHYQHQKQQILAMEKTATHDRHGSVSEADSDEENEEGDYTVYECPGLAPTGEMEVKNPLFQDDPTPAQTPAVKSTAEEILKK